MYSKEELEKVFSDAGMELAVDKHGCEYKGRTSSESSICGGDAVTDRYRYHLYQVMVDRDGEDEVYPKVILFAKKRVE